MPNRFHRASDDVSTRFAQRLTDDIGRPWILIKVVVDLRRSSLSRKLVRNYRRPIFGLKKETAKGCQARCRKIASRSGIGSGSPILFAVVLRRVFVNFQICVIICHPLTFRVHLSWCKTNYANIEAVFNSRMNHTYCYFNSQDLNIEIKSTTCKFINFLLS